VLSCVHRERLRPLAIDKEETMKKIALACAAAGVLASGIARADDDDRWDRREAVHEFVTLPAGVRFPEGITANKRTGEIYVGTFDFGPNANKLLRYSRHGKLLASRDFDGTPLLGLAFDREHGQVYIANVQDLAGLGPAKIQRIAADFAAGTPVIDVANVPSVGAPGNRVVGNPDGSNDVIQFGNNAPAPNALAFDRHGGLYISDSFQGAVFHIANVAACPAVCSVTTVVHDPLLATAGFPPFGANGLALSRDGETLFVANTGDDRILKVDLAAKTVSVFTESINGADGLAFDDDGRLWAAANQNDEVVAVNDKGRVIKRLGEFQGIGRDGAPRGLLFPASLVIVDDWMYVTNLALPLNGVAGDEPEEDVTRWTVSRIRLPQR
jgi:DNA-binding beta-propeller fold protein YncE